MAKKKLKQQPSKTAMFAALYRAIAHRELAGHAGGGDYLAETFLPGMLRILVRFAWVRASVRRKSDALTPGFYEYVVARTAFVDELFQSALASQMQQIVLLGAGYDTRAYRFAAQNRSTTVFELDAPEMLARKRMFLSRAGICVPERVAFAPLDFNRDVITDVLELVGYDETVQTLFVWEGVSYYLQPEAARATLDVVRNNAHPRSAIAFDYALTLDEGSLDSYHGAREFLKTWKKRRSAEPFEFTVDAGQFPSFLGSSGLVAAQHLNSGQIEQAFLRRADGTRLGRAPGFFEFAVAIPDRMSEECGD